jgi:hypothetical protein
VRLWHEPGVLLIILEETGIIYENQTCGCACYQSSAEGILVPFNNDPPLDQPELSTAAQLSSLLEGAHYLTNEADRIDAILASDWVTRCARVDRFRLRDSGEAWVYVNITEEADSFLTGFGNCRGVLTWQNSD